MNKKIRRILLLVLSFTGGIFVCNAFASAYQPPVAPEPISTSLFLLGGAALGMRTYLKKRKK